MLPVRQFSEITWLRAVVIALLVGGAGVGFLIAAPNMKGWGYPALEPVVANIGGLLIASVSLGLIWETVSRKSLTSEVMAIAGLSDDVRKAGLIGLTTDFY